MENVQVDWMDIICVTSLIEILSQILNPLITSYTFSKVKLWQKELLDFNVLLTETLSPISNKIVLCLHCLQGQLLILLLPATSFL